MKTIKALPSFLVAGTLLIGAACTSTNTGTGSGSTSGSAAGSGSGAGATSGTSATSTNAMGTGTDTGAGSGGSMGASGTAGTSGAAGTDMSGTAGGTTASGATAAADLATFVGTFATMKDPVFLMNAASSDLLEVQAAQTALQKSTSPSVKKFAQMMANHHSKTTQELQTVATPLGVTLPPAMMPVHQALFERLTNKTGRNFDEAYMDLMETAHKTDVAMYEAKSKAADTPTVKAFATKTLPMLRSHLTMASTIEKKVD